MLRIFIALGVGLATVGRLFALVWREHRREQRDLRESAAARAAAVADQERASQWRKANRWEVN